MQVTIGGCRGTRPVTDPAFQRYGGNTTAFLVQGSQGEKVLIDAGTGARALGRRLLKSGDRPRLLQLFTHFHLDHITGLPSLEPLQDRRWRITIAAPSRSRQTVRRVVTHLLHAPLWPLQIDAFGADVRFKTLPPASGKHALREGSLRIRWCPVNHPGGCTAYRIEDATQAVVIATDMEWARATPPERAALQQLCSVPFPASLLIMDGQYNARNYAAHAGWGHSTWRECIALARATAVGRLLITHHGARQNDRALDRLARQVRRAWPKAGLARAGQSIRLQA